jgi:hypothetical protein
MLEKPLLVMVEAKQNNFTEGWGQCLAELLTAQKLNQNDKAVHGIVTDGELWQFGKLEGMVFTKNETVVAVSDLQKLFAALAYVLNEVGK